MILSDAISQLETLARRPTNEEVAKMLAALASMLQVETPDQLGMQLYASALSDVSIHGLRQSARAIIKTHKWPRLPYPSELIEQASYHDAEIRMWQDQLRRALTAFEG